MTEHYWLIHAAAVVIIMTLSYGKMDLTIEEETSGREVDCKKVEITQLFDLIE